MISKHARRGFVVLLLFLVLTATMGFAEGVQEQPASRAKNVILMITDGTNVGTFTLGRWYKGAPLASDAILTGMIKTHNFDSVVPDSAAAASTYATGVRTYQGALSVGPMENGLSIYPSTPKDMQYRPMATVLEGAKLQGRATGLVCTVEFNSATPAAFIAHALDRGMDDPIAEQGVYSGLDVYLGGGRRTLTVPSDEGQREDGENLLNVLKQKGYQIVETADEMMGLKSGKVMGLFTRKYFWPEVDRAEYNPWVPPIAEMTAKAIEILSQDPDGFFLMVEGSQVDWGNHENDPINTIEDFIAFDAAVQVALDFAIKDGNTLLIVTSDHDCGALTVGNNIDSEYVSIEQLINPIKQMKSTAMAIWEEQGIEDSVDVPTVQRVVKKFWGVDFTDAEAAEAIASGKLPDADEDYQGLGEVYSKYYTEVGFVTHGHTGNDVPLHAYGPGKPTGLLDAPELGLAMAKAMGLDMMALNSRLFVDAGRAFGSAMKVDKSDEANPVVRIDYGGKRAELPVNKNILKIGNAVTELEGVVVYIETTDKAYIPLQAVNIIKGISAPLPDINN